MSIIICNLDILCKEQMRLQVLDIGEWVRFPETIHEFYAHLAEMIGKTSLLYFGDLILIKVCFSIILIFTHLMDLTPKILDTIHFNLYDILFNFCNISPLSQSWTRTGGWRNCRKKIWRFLYPPMCIVLSSTLIGSTQAGQADQRDQGQAAGVQG